MAKAEVRMKLMMVISEARVQMLIAGDHQPAPEKQFTQASTRRVKTQAKGKKRAAPALDETPLSPKRASKTKRVD